MKDELRYKYKIKRKYFQHSAREVANGCICDLFMQYLGGYDSFFIYHSFGSEADTHAVISALLAAGKTVCLPRVEGNDIVPVRYGGGQLKCGAFGICEPEGQAFTEKIDVIAVPLLAINKDGYRLGYGGGYYDRYLSGSDAVKVGIGFYLQLCDDFVPDKWDEPLDKFICERGMFDFGRRK